MKIILNWKLALLFIILISIFLRFYQLNSIPGSLIPDEVALGFTSFSILKTGADVHGNYFPISFNVFGTAWSLIGYPLTEIISQFFLGLNEWSVRIPSAMSGVLGVILIHQIAQYLFKKKLISLLAAFSYAISPWNVFFSRLGLEYNFALTIFLLGLYLFLRYIFSNDKNNLLLLISFLILFFTELIYYPYVIFTPLFTIGLLILFREKIQPKRIVFLSILALVVLNFLVFTLIRGTSLSESSSQSIFNDKSVIYDRVEKFRTDNSNEDKLIEKILHNKYLGVSYQIVQNFMNTFSPSFLFDKGGDKIERDIGYFGKLYAIDGLFLFFGFASLFYKRDKNILFLSMWLILSTVASSITKGAPSSSRVYMIMPLFTLISSYGFYYLINILNINLMKKALLCGIISLYLINFIFFFDAFFVHFNYQRVRFFHFGYKQIVELSNKYPKYNIVFRGPDNFPYVYFLFYNNYDPNKFRKEIRYYKASEEGFVYAKSFDRFSFPWLIDYSVLKNHTIYIDDTNIKNAKNKILLPSGEPILGYEIIN